MEGIAQALNDVIFRVRSFRKKWNGATLPAIWATCAPSSAMAPVDQKVELLLDFATRVQHIGHRVLADGSRQGPVGDRVGQRYRSTASLSKRMLRRRLDLRATYASRCCRKHMYWPTSSCATAGELYNLSNALLGVWAMTKFEELQSSSRLLDRMDEVTDKAAFRARGKAYVRGVDEAWMCPHRRPRQLRANFAIGLVSLRRTAHTPHDARLRGRGRTPETIATHRALRHRKVSPATTAAPGWRTCSGSDYCAPVASCTCGSG